MYTSGRVVVRSLLAFYFCLSTFAHADEAANSSFECKAEESYLEFLNGLENPFSHEESYSCFQVLEEADSEHALLVDIRPADEFQKVRIPGSINLTKSQLLSTGGLKSRSLLIVDKGFSRTALAQMCAKAEAEGFSDFRILLGGVAAWRASGKRLEGLPEHFTDLHNIEPREFLVELKQNRVSILATEAYSEPLQAISSPELIVSKLDPELPLERQLVSHFQRVGPGEQVPVVLLGAEEIVQESTPVFRSVFALDSSPRQLADVYQKHLVVAGKRQAIPDRFKCGG